MGKNGILTTCCSRHILPMQSEKNEVLMRIKRSGEKDGQHESATRIKIDEKIHCQSSA